MSGRRPVAVGAFVLVGLVLAIVSLLMLGGARWFAASDQFVVHFDETLQGLHVGAQVSYRGVPVGEVVSIKTLLDPNTTVVAQPVVLRLRKDALVIVGGGEPTPATLAKLIDRGLRAQLQIESLVTARLYVDMDLFPGSPAPMHGMTNGLPEIPSVRSPIAGIKSSIDELTMAAPALLDRASNSLEGLRDLLAGDTGKELRRGITAAADLATALNEADGPLRKALAELPATAAAARQTAAGLDALTGSLTKLIGGQEQKIADLLVEAGKTSAAIRKAAEQAGGLLGQTRPEIAEFTQRGLPELMGLVEDANRMVNEMTGLVRDIRQSPARFLFGDPTREGVKLK